MYLTKLLKVVPQHGRSSITKKNAKVKYIIKFLNHKRVNVKNVLQTENTTDALNTIKFSSCSNILFSRNKFAAHVRPTSGTLVSHAH